MKHLLSIFLFLCFTAAFAQQITFSSEVKNSTDENVKQIAEVWEKYIQKFQQNPDTAAILYWNTVENKQGEDIIRYNFSGFYYRIKVFTYNIKPSTNKDFYEINSLSLIKNESDINDVVAVFRVCAAKENGEFKLYNYFYTIKDRLNNYSVDGIEYYYPCDYIFDKGKAQQSSVFLKNTLEKYNFEQQRKINYIVANSLDECNQLIGFHYTVVSSSNAIAGAFRYPNTLISTNVSHFHELTHSIFNIQFSNAPMILIEGIPTYYGGNTGIDFNDLKITFKKYFTENSQIDLSDFKTLYKSNLLPDGTNPYYIVGALLIDYALKNGGEQAVLRLFEYTDENINEMFSNEFNIKREDIHNFILQLFSDN